MQIFRYKLHIDGSVQDCSIFIANALEIPRPCCKAPIWSNRPQRICILVLAKCQQELIVSRARGSKGCNWKILQRKSKNKDYFHQSIELSIYQRPAIYRSWYDTVLHAARKPLVRLNSQNLPPIMSEYSLSGKTSYHPISSRSREIWCDNDRNVLNFDRYLGSTAAEVCLSNFRTIEKVYTRISRL